MRPTREFGAASSRRAPSPRPAFFGIDACRFFEELGMEGIVCGPGGRYNTMPNEKVDSVDYLDMIRICVSATPDICEVS
jgi:acetylornithine deacetylase